MALRRADMEELSVIAIIDGSRFLEKTLHHVLEPHRVRGEWFVDCAEVRAEIDSAIAGRYPLEAEKKLQVIPAPVAEILPEEPGEPAFSPEYEIVAKLSDEVEAAIARNADKYEVRGYAEAFLAASEMFIQQRETIDQTRKQLRRSR